MKKIATLIILSVFLVQSIAAQDQERYKELIGEAWELYQEKEYLSSGQKYAEAFVALGNKGDINDRYNAACSWALAGQPDSAFVQLFKIAESGYYTNLGHITTDTDLNTLHDDERWPRVIAIVATNKEKAEEKLDKPLVALLDSVFKEDQKYRMQMKEVEEKYGWESEEMKRLIATMHEKDSINLIQIKQILDKRGWLGPDIIGNQGNLTLFLVIQHADLATQEQYLPMLREAVEKGNAQASSLALMEDRVALRKGEKQIYGSQVRRDEETGAWYVRPLIDPDNVDERRAAVGLPPIQQYISNWGMTWDVEEYKKKLPRYIEKEQ